jgi:GDP-D-mannose dehydratase
LKTAIITGITGQDGSYLAELLLSKGYKVIGAKRRSSLICTDRIDHIFDHENFYMEYFDLNDSGCIYRLLAKYRPHEFYNLAAQSHVRVSFDIPENTVDGIAGDYVEAMWLMLQQEKPEDFVISTGETHSVKDFLEFVFEAAGLDTEQYVEIDERLFRPHEVPYLLGDCTKAKEKLGWTPKITFKDLAKLMYEEDLRFIKENK